MHRWKSMLLNQWRAKIASLVIAVLVWLVLRHAAMPPPAVPSAPASTQIR